MGITNSLPAILTDKTIPDHFSGLSQDTEARLSTGVSKQLWLDTWLKEKDRKLREREQNLWKVYMKKKKDLLKSSLYDSSNNTASDRDTTVILEASEYGRCI